jgi:AcrR family transcriptional regulator
MIPALLIRRVRADAQRNRAKVLQVAWQAFATDGLTVPVHEIARRAGVGTGTVSRHFPTKESLFAAVLFSRVEEIVKSARSLLEADDPGAAFFDFFERLIAEGAASQGVAEALIGAGFDLEVISTGDDYNVMGLLTQLLVRAQQAGAVRRDVEIGDVKALLGNCTGRGDDASRQRMTAIARAGLRS